MKPVYVYVAGPLSHGNVVDNVRRAVLESDILLSHGYTPYCPHLTHYWAMIAGDRSWDEWLSFDELWLARCDVVLRLPGDSPGAEREVAFARNHGIPVVYSIGGLTERFPLTSKISALKINPCGHPSCRLCYGAPEG